MSVLKDLVKLADHLDRKGLHKESDVVDSLITKMAGDPFAPGRGMDRITLPGDEGDDPDEGGFDLEDLIEGIGVEGDSAALLMAFTHLSKEDEVKVWGQIVEIPEFAAALEKELYSRKFRR